MTVFAEFALVAVLLYLWESSLWLPLRGIVLRKQWFGKRWKALDPRSIFAVRKVGLIPMFPVPPDAGLAPCQAPPLFADADGLWLENEEGRIEAVGRIGWEELKEDHHYLVAGSRKTKLTSARYIEVLRRAKKRGATPETAVNQALRLAISPSHAGREWKRWKLVSNELRFICPLLTLGFFVGLPLAYVKLGTLPTVILGLWLWVLMAWTAGILWWLGRRVYPEVKSTFQMDALLSLVVPFHAMRSMEMASVHAMGTTHPVGLILASGDFENPWLAAFVRRILHPTPDEIRLASAIKSPLASALESCGIGTEEFNKIPNRCSDPEASAYCPRCQSLFLEGTETCSDCNGMRLCEFSRIPTSPSER